MNEIKFVVQQWREGNWINYGEHSDELQAYESCHAIEQVYGWWRIIEYPNGRGQYPIRVFDELKFEINGRTVRAGERR